MADDLDQAIAAAEETTRQLEWTKRLAIAFDRIPGALEAASAAAGVDAEWACKTLGDILETIADELKPSETLRIRRAGPMLLAAIPLETRPWHLYAISSMAEAERLGDWSAQNEDALQLYRSIMEHTVSWRDIERG